MFISNAKYEKRHGGTRNKRYFADNQAHTGIDLSDFEIPRYEEMKFLSLEDFED